MQTTRLPDGRYATTPFYAGVWPIPECCADDAHDWRDDVPVQIITGAAASKKSMLIQKCEICRYSRCVYTEESG